MATIYIPDKIRDKLRTLGNIIESQEKLGLRESQVIEWMANQELARRQAEIKSEEEVSFT